LSQLIHEYNNKSIIFMTREELKSAEILIDLALKEDVGTGDITTNSLIPSDTRRKAVMVCKADGVLAGLTVAEMVFRKLDETLVWQPKFQEGSKIIKGDILVEFTAGYRALLTGERTALNFVQRMSGIATTASKYTEQLKETATLILDTRKTLPGFRRLDKYAVRMGGAMNHRIGLFDLFMIKDNHIRVAGGIKKAIETIRRNNPMGLKIEVETTSPEEVMEAVNSGADIIMLDNMTTEMMKESVRLINGKAKTEASGNITIGRIREIAETGVDFISVGALTHSVIALDISQKITD
jgi:nicotinate-nucleotide pyrophosphorylase (carboxylating)